MKLNFWQWLGVVLLIVGVAMWIAEHRSPAPTVNPVPATVPASSP